MLSAAFKVRQETEPGMCPHLVNFPSGIPYDLTAMAFGIAELHDQHRIESQNGIHTFAFGVFDPDRGTIEASFGPSRVFSMTRLPDETDEVDEPVAAAPSYAATKRMLVDDFGSKKRKRALRAADMNMVDIVKAGSAGAIQHALNAGSEAQIKAVSVSNRPDYLPEYNATTTDRSQVYPIENIVPADLIACLSGKALGARVKANNFSNDPAIYKFIAHGLSSLRQEKSGMARDVFRQRLRYLTLLGYLMDMYVHNKTRVLSASDLAASLSAPEPIAEHLLFRFREEKVVDSGRVQYVTSGANRVALLCHICILALTVSDFSIPKTAFDLLPADLQILPDLEISTNDVNVVHRLSSHFQQIGAVMNRKASGIQVAVSLSAPLSLPSGARRPGRRVKK